MRRSGLVWGTGSRGRQGQAGAVASAGRGACEDGLGLGGLTLSPHTLLISLTPAGEAFARRWGRRSSQ